LVTSTVLSEPGPTSGPPGRAWIGCCASAEPSRGCAKADVLNAIAIAANPNMGNRFI
jgi:hypothetical protein